MYRFLFVLFLILALAKVASHTANGQTNPLVHLPLVSLQIPLFVGTLDLERKKALYLESTNDTMYNVFPSVTTFEFWAKSPEHFDGSAGLVSKPGSYEVTFWREGDYGTFFGFHGDGINAGRFGVRGWHHMAVVVWWVDTFWSHRTYIDGDNLSGGITFPVPIPNTSTLPLKIGTGTHIEIDELRISNAFRYPEGDFTPQSTPFNCDSNTVGLWHFDEGAESNEYANSCGDDKLVAVYGANLPYVGGLPEGE